MGEQNVNAGGTQELRVFSKRLLKDLKALEQMLQGGMVESGVRRIGAEQELALVDREWRPAPLCMEILERLDDKHFTTELGRFNLEFNLEPLDWGGDCLRRMEGALQELLDKAYGAAHEEGCEVILTGILPTLEQSDLGLENMAPKARYRALNDSVRRLRGDKFHFHITGREELIIEHDNVMLESCNTSFQVHFQVGPEEFARRYNVAQAVAGPLLASCTNSPLLFGHELWRETRIALFQQSVDTRKGVDHRREIEPRVSFGRDWVKESVLEIFQEDITRFRVLMSSEGEMDPLAEIAAGRAPDLPALRIHNSTVYRWNRACYGLSSPEKAHLRIENRLIPAGPTIVDEVANAAFWFGLMIAVDAAHPRLVEEMTFAEAEGNFFTAAQRGLGSKLIWPGLGEVPAERLILDHLLPMAREALAGEGIASEDIERYLGIVEARVSSGRTGSHWMLESLAGMRTHSTRSEGLASLVAATAMRQVGGQPVHTWSAAHLGEAGDVTFHFARVEQIMTSDLFTTGESEPLEMAAQVMSWHNVSHLPVESGDGKLVGLVTYRHLLKRLGEGSLDELAVRDVMERDVVTAPVSMRTLDAARLMSEKDVTCLPVVSEEGRLVGIVSESDLLAAVVRLLEAETKQEQDRDG
jgi:CBS domain-containing protein